MPIEIRELVVRARIDPGMERPAAERHGIEYPQRSMPGGYDPAGGERIRQEEIVQACVREVLRILEDKSER